jgi:hypothetical protein
VAAAIENGMTGATSALPSLRAMSTPCGPRLCCFAKVLTLSVV